MPEIKKILVPFDFSPDSRKALQMGLLLAQKYKADLHVLSVIERTPDDEVLKLIVLPKDVESRLKQKIHEEIHTLLPQIDWNTIKIHPATRQGKASVEILLKSEREKVDLIVMGTQGRTGLKNIMLGSVAEKVVRKAGVPVWVCRGEKIQTPQTILVPLDFSDSSLNALEWAVQRSKDFNARLHLLHVVDLRDLYTFDLLALEKGPRLEMELKNQAQKRLESWAKTLSVPHQLEVKLGSPVDEILTSAKENAIDLVLLATHGRTGLKHLVMGSVAEQIVRSSPCSVMTIRPTAFFQSSVKMFEGEKSFEEYMKSFRD